MLGAPETLDRARQALLMLQIQADSFMTIVAELDVGCAVQGETRDEQVTAHSA
ncbi:hypothetical protein D3C85_1716030 [compost metagenome]